MTKTDTEFRIGNRVTRMESQYTVLTKTNFIERLPGPITAMNPWSCASRAGHTSTPNGDSRGSANEREG